MAVLPGSPVTGGGTLKTAPNTAYEKMKQREQEGGFEDDYDFIRSLPGGHPPNIDETYDTPTLPARHQCLQPSPVVPPTSSNVGVPEKAEAVDESIPDDR